MPAGPLAPKSIILCEAERVYSWPWRHFLPRSAGWPLQTVSSGILPLAPKGVEAM